MPSQRQGNNAIRVHFLFVTKQSNLAVTEMVHVCTAVLVLLTLFTASTHLGHEAVKVPGRPPRISPRGWQAAMVSEKPWSQGLSDQKPAAAVSEQPAAVHQESCSGNSGAGVAKEALLAHLAPQLALAAICFAAGAMVGYQYAVTSQSVRTAPGTAEGEGADPEADWIDEKSSARKQLRSSGVAAAAAIQSEAADHSQGKLYASADAEHAPPPSSEDSARSSTPPNTTSCAPASTGDQNQPSGSLTNDRNAEPAPSQEEDVEEELPYVHVQTPRGSQPSEAASPCTPGMSTPESTGGAGGSTEPHTTADGWSRRETDAGLPEAAECFGSPCSSVEERVAQSAECSSSGRGTVGFVQLSTAPGLQHMRWAMGSEGGQWPQLEHWDEANAFWGAFSRQLNVRLCSCSSSGSVLFFS